MRYAHTSITARDWRALADFYVEVFGCHVKPPERRLSGDWLTRGTGVPGAELEGVHLLLPGHGTTGPTLEIFTYRTLEDRAAARANERGLAHLAFEVADVDATLEEILAHGGSDVGEVTVCEIPGMGRLKFVYARDPEGNVIELQAWA